MPHIEATFRGAINIQHIPTFRRTKPPHDDQYLGGGEHAFPYPLKGSESAKFGSKTAPRSAHNSPHFAFLRFMSLSDLFGRHARPAAEPAVGRRRKFWPDINNFRYLGGRRGGQNANILSTFRREGANLQHQHFGGSETTKSHSLSRE